MPDTHNTAPTRFIDASGIKYAYRRFGALSGTPLVFLQHFRGALDNWDPQLTDGLAKDRPVILFNNAGVASTGGEPASTVSGMAKHVSTFTNALGLKRVDLLGFSLGGFVAQQLALESPNLVRRVILAGTGPQGGEGMDAFTPKVAEHATQKTPVIENFLYLFFSASKASQAAGRAFWERRHARADQDVTSSLAAMDAQARAIASWDSPENRPICSAHEHQAAGPHRERTRRYHGTEHQLLHPSAAHTECDSHYLPGLRPWSDLSIC
jgi:pimeloyl-ACP methyl ester carboxylesterase